jgi:hypothetical protein
MVFSYKTFTLNEANIHIWRIFLVNHYNNGSQNTVVETDEQTWVVYQVAEPSASYMGVLSADQFMH